MTELTDEILWGTAENGVWIARREDAVTDFDLDPSRLAESAPLVDGGTPQVTDYGNNGSLLRVGVTRQHASPQASRQFIMAHAKAIAALSQSVVRPLTCKYHGGGVVTFTIPAAVLTSFPGRMLGATSIHQYTFVGQAVS